MGREALQSNLGLLDRKSFRERYLKPALTVKGSHWLAQYSLWSTGQGLLGTTKVKIFKIIRRK